MPRLKIILPTSRGIRDETFLSLLQEYARNRPNRLTNQKYESSGFVAKPLPPQIRDGQFPIYVAAEPLANCICGNLALAEVYLKCL